MRTTRSRTETRAAQPDPLSLLTADHRKVRASIERFESALEGQTAQQKQVAEQICRELEIHSEIEEEIFYPALAQNKALASLVGKALKEHAQVKESIHDIRQGSPADALFGSHVLHLMEEVEQHVEEEENVMFPEVEKQLLQRALADLGQCLQKRKQELMSMARNELRPRKAG